MFSFKRNGDDDQREPLILDPTFGEPISQDQQ
jgi:hypothetical protein